MAECPSHPGAESVGTCARCGRFYCAPERIELDDKPYCGDCGVREDVDWLGHHYRRLEGRRSGVAWFLLFVGLGLVLAGLVALFAGTPTWRSRTIGVGLVLFGLSCINHFTGRPAHRKAPLVGALVAGPLFVVGADDLTAALSMLPMLLLGGAAWTDVRTKLFFRVPVPRKDLYRHYQREGSNPLAVQASRLALLGLFVPGVCLISLVMGVISLTRINSKAVPPVGNLSAGLAAVVFSLGTTLFWGLSFMSARW